MKLRTAFVLSLLAVTAVMALPAIHGVQRIQEVRLIALDLREQVALASLEVGRLQAGLARLDRYHRSFIASPDPALGRHAFATLDSLAAHTDRIRLAGYAEVVEASDFPLPELRGAVRATDRLVSQGRLEDATLHLDAAVLPLLEVANRAVWEMATAIDESTIQKIQRADELAAAALRASMGALAVAFLVAAILTFFAARVLTRPIDRLSTAMASVADGSFDPPENLPYHRSDELGVLFRAFRSMALRLADLDRMKAELVGLASHDLKTPVNVIAGYAEMIDEELGTRLEPRQRRLVRSLREQTTTLGRRLDQLLEISRMEASGLDLGLEEINVRHFATGIHKSYAPIAVRNAIRFRVVVEDTAPSFFIADPDCLLTEVFAHLLENCFRFTPRGGRIDLRIAGKGGIITTEIRDTGTSIAAEHLPYVFDRYYQGQPGRVGNGPGLPIARAAVLAHGGQIQVATPTDGGIIFSITLPLHPTGHKALA